MFSLNDEFNGVINLLIGSTREQFEVSITDFDEICHACSFRKYSTRIFLFLLIIVDVKRVKTTLEEIERAEYILSNILEITGDTVLL